MIEITRDSISGCDFEIHIDTQREVRLLQITDMQVIDSSQRRTCDRLRIDEINAWRPECFDAQCGDHIRSLVSQVSPDLIFITGDIVYGSFDDNGSVLKWMCSLMDSFEIPWAPVFGNHDNESEMGVAWQCNQLENSKYCLFKRGNVSGNSNYSVGIRVRDKLVRVLHMVDSNGCRDSKDPNVIKERGIYPDQLGLIRSTAERIDHAECRHVPAFIAFHIPVEDYERAEMASGYMDNTKQFYTIGVDMPAKNGDFG